MIIAIVLYKGKTTTKRYKWRKILDTRVQWKSSGKKRVRRRLNAFLDLAETPPKTTCSNRFLRINSGNTVTVFAFSSPTSFIGDRQTDHTWSLLLFRSLRLCPAQLSTITISYSIFIDQVVERCNFPENVNKLCSISCCYLDF